MYDSMPCSYLDTLYKSQYLLIDTPTKRPRTQFTVDVTFSVTPGRSERKSFTADSVDDICKLLANQLLGEPEQAVYKWIHDMAIKENKVFMRVLHPPNDPYSIDSFLFTINAYTTNMSHNFMLWNITDNEHEYWMEENVPDRLRSSENREQEIATVVTKLEQILGALKAGDWHSQNGVSEMWSLDREMEMDPRRRNPPDGTQELPFDYFDDED